MIARILWGLMLLQLLAVLGLCCLALHAWGIEQPAVALLLALAIVLAARALIVACGFWHSRRFGSPVPPEHRLDAFGAVRLFLGELRATLWASSWGMLRPRLSQVPAPGLGLPVLLIHGYACNRGYWRHLSRQLAQAGIVHHAIDLEPLGADIDGFVPQVEQDIQALCALTGREQVILVAHSMGGLVARAYLRRHGARRVARVITLGTPHHGTALANLALGRNARQMRRVGGQPEPWLAQLAASETPEMRTLFTSLYTHHDNIVAPQASAYLPGARNIAIKGVGHVALASDARVSRLVLAEMMSMRETDSSPSCSHSG